MEQLTLVIGFVQIFLQAMVAFFSFYILRMAPKSRFWYFISFSFLLIVFRRSISFSIELGLIPKDPLWSFLDFALLPTIISILMLLSIFELWRKVKNKHVEINKIKEYLN